MVVKMILHNVLNNFNWFWLTITGCFSEKNHSLKSGA
jgi:hypothetical protein